MDDEKLIKFKEWCKQSRIDRLNFRVWKGLENKMIYNVAYLNPFLLDERLSEEAKHNIVMQCVGRRDTKDTLIYENDFIQADAGLLSDDGDMFEIIWHPDYCQFLAHSFKRQNCLDLMDIVKPVVIGNRYENPELVEKVEWDGEGLLNDSTL